MKTSSWLLDEVQPVFTEHGITASRFDALEALSRRGGRARPAELRDMLHLPAQTITGVIDHLEAADLVRRSPNPADRRSTLVELTAAGQAALDQICPPLIDIEEDCMATLSPADQPRIIDDAFYTDTEESAVSVLESIFLWAPPAIAVTDLVVNGILARYPDLRVGIVELSSVWVPQYLMMLDGGWEFTTKLNGTAPAALDARPSEYFRRQVRVSSFSYEQPARLTAKAGDLFMCCSDFPHSEGTATPIEDYRGAGSDPEEAAGFFHDNVAGLLTA